MHICKSIIGGTETIKTFFMTMLVAMLPVVELRGAIPYGVIAGMSPWLTFVAAIIGNMIPVPFILLLIRKIFQWLRTFPWWYKRIDALEKRAHIKGRMVHKYRTLGLLLLVAIPLPGTGAWTGSLVAAILDIRMKTAIPTIILGVIIAGVIALMLTFGVGALFGGYNSF